MQTEIETTTDSPLGCKTLLAAWADRCGIDVDDERVEYGWPKDFGYFRDGWKAAIATLMRGEEVREDDREPITEEWLRMIGADDSEQAYWGFVFDDDTWPLYVKRSQSYPGVWSATVDGSPWPIDMRSRGCVRRLLIALQRRCCG